LYVDDMAVASTVQHAIEWIFNELLKHFKLSRSPLRKLIGYTIHYDQAKRCITLDMNSFTQKFVDETKHLLQNFPISSVLSPLDEKCHLSRQDCPQNEEEKKAMSKLPFRQVIGSLNYLSCHARPDISFATNFLARFMDNPGMGHWEQLLRVVAYLRDNPIAYIRYNSGSTKDYSIQNTPYKMTNNHIYCYSDADLASSDLDKRKSTTGYCIFYNNGLISWKSALQSSVSSSTTEAEYKAVHEAAKESVWISNLLNELGFKQAYAPFIFEDNTSTINATQNSTQHSQLKHLDIKYHQIREFVENKQVVLWHVTTHEQFADQLTKAQKPEIHQFFMKHLVEIPPEQR